jgi:hypothetical protein
MIIDDEFEQPENNVFQSLSNAMHAVGNATIAVAKAIEVCSKTRKWGELRDELEDFVDKKKVQDGTNNRTGSSEN